MARNVVLYTLVPEAEEHARLAFAAPTRLRWRLGNLLDGLRWRCVRDFRFKSYRYERFRCSNLGDVAVRAAVAAELARRLDPGVAVRQLRWGSLTPDSLEEINRTADLLVIAGGGYLSADRQGELIPRCRADLELFRRLRVPLVSFGIGLNMNLEDRQQAEDPRLSETARGAVGEFVRRHALLAVRDPFTRRQLAEASGQDVRLAPDPVFFLEPGPALRRVAAGEGGRGGAGRPPRVGINLAFHGRHLEAGLARSFPRYLEILKRLRRDGCRLVYFRHSDPERLPLGLLAAEGLVDECVEGDRPGQRIAAYAGVDLVIGEMMHAAIMALAAGTPVLSVGYDVKHRALFELLGLQDWLVDPLVEPLDTLGPRAAAILGDLPGARARLLSAVGRLEAPHGGFGEALEALLHRLGLGAAPASPMGGEAMRA